MKIYGLPSKSVGTELQLLKLKPPMPTDFYAAGRTS